MPLFRLKQIREDLTLVIWKITETEEQLRRGVKEYPSDQKKASKITHPSKRLEFFALRQCLLAALGTNPEVLYTTNGKPYLAEGPKISFTHTLGYAGVIISKTLHVGIDLEIIKPTIARVAPKFIGETEKNFVSSTNLPMQTAIWGAKEVIVKIEGNKKLNFKAELEVKPFQLNNKATTTAFCRLLNTEIKYAINIEQFNELMLCYGWRENLDI